MRKGREGKGWELSEGRMRVHEGKVSGVHEGREGKGWKLLEGRMGVGRGFMREGKGRG